MEVLTPPYIAIQSESVVNSDSNNLSWELAIGELEGKNATECAAAVRESLIQGDHTYVLMNNKIGDMVQVTALIKGLREAQNQLGKQKPLTLLFYNKSILELYKPFAEEQGIEVKECPPMQGRDVVEDSITDKNEQNCLVIDLENEGGHPIISKNKYRTFIRDIFINFNGKYNNNNAGTERYVRFTEAFLGLKPNTLNSRNLLPEIKLPKDANEIYNNLVKNYTIDQKKRQVGILLEASSPGRMYDHYDRVVSDIKRQLGNTVEINMIFDPRRQPSDAQRQEWEKIVKTQTDGSVKLVSMGLQDVSVFLANQDVVLGSDSGLSHIAGNVEDGPIAIPLYIPSQVDPSVWETNPERMRGITPPFDEMKGESRIYGIRCADPDKKWINKISPEVIANKAIGFLRSRGERPHTTLDFEENLGFLYQDILQRSPHQYEISYFISTRQSPQEVSDVLRNSLEKKQRDVSNLYKSILGRNVDVEGLRIYSDYLQEGHTIGFIRSILANSTELHTTMTNIASLDRAKAIEEVYLRILGRPIDADGRSTYINNSSINIQTVIDALTSSYEFTKSFLEASEDRQAIEVEEAYREVLGRNADINGFKHYLNRVQQGYSIEGLKQELFMSSEGESVMDSLSITNRRKAIGILYEILLGREIDESGVNSYVNNSNTSWREIMHILTSSEEYKNRKLLEKTFI